jgi:hypothetical protein
MPGGGGIRQGSHDGAAMILEIFGNAHWMSCLIEFGDDRVNAIAQLKQLLKRALFHGYLGLETN